mmetsp:Transcript_16202/g.27920  ORF Transcript_16202/g.27920 Transcript_16202/m.27920 type:complete len:92 (+) Transcript_16202:128-403(+)
MWRDIWAEQKGHLVAPMFSWEILVSVKTDVKAPISPEVQYAVPDPDQKEAVDKNEDLTEMLWRLKLDKTLKRYNPKTERLFSSEILYCCLN